MSKLIQKIEKGKNGNLYGAVDVTEGEYTVDELRARADQREKQFAEQYKSSIADDSDGPTTAEKYPTKMDLSKFGFEKN